MLRNILHKKEIITITTHVGINANRKRVHRNKNLITQVMDCMRDDEQRTYQKSHIKKSPDVSIRAFQFGGEGDRLNQVQPKPATSSKSNQNQHLTGKSVQQRPAENDSIPYKMAQ